MQTNESGNLVESLTNYIIKNNITEISIKRLSEIANTKYFVPNKIPAISLKGEITQQIVKSLNLTQTKYSYIYSSGVIGIKVNLKKKKNKNPKLNFFNESKVLAELKYFLKNNNEEKISITTLKSFLKTKNLSYPFELSFLIKLINEMEYTFSKYYYLSGTPNNLYLVKTLSYSEWSEYKKNNFMASETESNNYDKSSNSDKTKLKRNYNKIIEGKIERQRNYLNYKAETGACSSRGNVIHTWQTIYKKEKIVVPRSKLKENVNCSSCGKEIIITKNVSKYRCPHCGTTVVRMGNLYH